MKILDQKVRDSILTSDMQNILVKADAGCGKTTILVDKMHEITKQIKNHKKLAALTFTNRATYDLRNKVNKISEESKIIVTTNNSFIEHQIIRNFLTDVYGRGYATDFIVKYNKSFACFEKGLEVLKNENILGVYCNKSKNFQFELALKILRNSKACQNFLIAKFRMLFLDEYQDSDEDMHKLFMYINEELDIPLFIVGDEKQAIYLWRGAKENIFDSFGEDYRKYNLFHNFRSHQNITNFANLIHNSHYFENNAIEPEEVILFNTSKSFNESIYELLNNNLVDLHKEVTIIINNNRSAEECSQYLKERNFNFIFIPRTPIEEGFANTSELKVIAKFILNKDYSIFNFADDMFISLNSMERDLIKKSILNLKNAKTFDDYFSEFIKIGEIINLKFSGIEIEKFKETIENKVYHKAFLNNTDKHRIMTVFSTKGLEFDQVLIRANDYGLQDRNSLNNHYVALTRAKESVIIINNTRNYKSIIKQKLSAKKINNLDDVLYTISI